MANSGEDMGMSIGRVWMEISNAIASVCAKSKLS
jgi:hypothetical protein